MPMGLGSLGGCNEHSSLRRTSDPYVVPQEQGRLWGQWGWQPSVSPAAVGPQTGWAPWDMDEQDEAQGRGAARVAWGQPLPV